MKTAYIFIITTFMLFSFTMLNVSAHWADNDADFLISTGILTQNDELLKDLNRNISRVEISRLVVELLDSRIEPEPGARYFTDIQESAGDDYYFSAKAKLNGYVLGFDDGTFKPKDDIKRQDFFTILGRACKLSADFKDVKFIDTTDISSYSKPYIAGLYKMGIINGYSDGSIEPNNNITVGEAIATVNRTIYTDHTYPTLVYSLTEKNGERMLYVDASDNIRVKSIRYVDAKYSIYSQNDNVSIDALARMLPDYFEATNAFLLSNVNYEANTKKETLYDACGGKGSYDIILEYRNLSKGKLISETGKNEDLSMPVQENGIKITSSTVYYICIEDIAGNQYFERISVEGSGGPSQYEIMYSKLSYDGYTPINTLIPEEKSKTQESIIYDKDTGETDFCIYNNKNGITYRIVSISITKNRVYENTTVDVYIDSENRKVGTVNAIRFGKTWYIGFAGMKQLGLI